MLAASAWRASVSSAARSTRRIAGTGISALLRCARSGSTRCGGWSRPAIRSRRAPQTWRRSKPASLRPSAARASADPGQRFRAARAARVTPMDTVRRLKRRHPEHRFIWLLGSDTLPNFHKWRDWRGLAREVPIAVIRRPGYDSAAHAARAMGWLRRFVHPSSQATTGRSGVHRRSFSFACRPTRRPQPPFVRKIPAGIAERHRCARLAPHRRALFARRPLDRTSR